MDKDSDTPLKIASQKSIQHELPSNEKNCSVNNFCFNLGDKEIINLLIRSEPTLPPNSKE